jgi:dTDP-4-amino-4,6-dideoxygalactose transaminase
MPNINAALGVAQLEQIDKYLTAKRKLAKTYINFFAKTEIQFIPEPENSRANYWLNCVLLSNRNERDVFLKYTNENGVMTRPVWELMNRLPMFKNHQCDNLNNAEWIVDRLVNIPSSVILQ